MTAQQSNSIYAGLSPSGHLDAIANGLGSQSMSLVVLAARGLLNCTVSITADTGAESDCLWNTGRRSTAREYFYEIVEPYCSAHGLQARFVRARNKFKLELKDLMTHVRDVIDSGKAPAIPLFGSKGGQLRQGCTQKWKIVAIHQEARRLGAKTLRTAQGIHYGEADRRVKGRFLYEEGAWSIYQETVKTKAGPKDIKWCTHLYPLVDLRMYRDDCRELLDSEGLPYLVSSECDHCPHKDFARWDRTSPEKLIEIALLEHSMGGEYFFTSNRIPLLESIEKMRDKADKKTEPDFGCGNGHCGI